MTSTENNVLVVILHAYVLTPAKYKSLVDLVKEKYPKAKVIVPSLPLSLFSCADPNKIVIDVLSTIDEEWSNMEQPHNAKIILIGHSTGALLVRKAYIIACGENPDAPFELIYKNQKQRQWAKHVERLILFAGINRGWSLNPHMPIPEAIKLSIAILLGKTMSFFGAHPVAFKTKKGATFITQLRIQSLEMQKKSSEKGVGNALTVQLLGTQDVLVSPSDNIDLVTGSNFVYLDIPESNHVNVIDMAGNGGCRKGIVIDALTLSEKDLRETRQVTPDDESSYNRDDNVTDVVFVIHGIRDTGFWTQKIARKVKKLGESTSEPDGRKRKFATETSTYGYFPMLQFLLSPFRLAKVQWLMDQYTENKARYPKAQFSYVGHSNGTYLLAKALEDYPACKFKNVLLAGSVVRKNYKWMNLKEQGRINSIYNYVATSDWVVGIFPKTLQTLKIQDLGSGGFDGFIELKDGEQQFKYIEGTHSAAIEEHVWDDIAHFIVNGKPMEKDVVKSERSKQWRLVGKFGPVIFSVLIICLIAIGAALVWLTVQFAYHLPDKTFTWTAIVLLLYVTIIWKILTKL